MHVYSMVEFDKSCLCLHVNVKVSIYSQPKLPMMTWIFCSFLSLTFTFLCFTHSTLTMCLSRNVHFGINNLTC